MILSNTNGFSSVTQYAGCELYLCIRHRLRALHSLSGDSMTISVEGVKAELRQHSETEFTHYRNFRNKRHLIADVIANVKQTDTF